MKNKREFLKYYGFATSLSFMGIAAAFLGIYLDAEYKTSPLFVLVFFFFFLFYLFYQVYLIVRKDYSKDKSE